MTAESLVSSLLQILSRPEDGLPVALRGDELIWGDRRFPLSASSSTSAKTSYLARRLGLEGVPPERMAEVWHALLGDEQPRSPRELLAAVRLPESHHPGPDETSRRWRAVVEPMLREIPATAGAVEAFGAAAPPEDLALRLELRPLLETWPRRLLHDPWWATVEAPLPNMSPLPLDEVWVDLQLLDPEEWPVLAGLESLRSLLDQRYEEQRWRAEPLALILERISGVAAFIGPPGSGKTTLLKWIARRLIQQPGSRYLLPLFVPLRRYVFWRRDGGEAGLLRFALVECGVRQPEQRSLWIQALNEMTGTWREKVLVLLDGWDEVPVEERELLLVELKDLAYGFSVLVTSRPAAFPARLAASRVYEVSNLAPDSTDALIRRWFHSTGKPGQAEALLRHLDLHPDLRRLARNPFLLTLLCVIAHQSQRREGLDLPATRAALYEQTIRLIYAHHEERYPSAPIGSDRQRQIERLALWLLDEAPGAPRFVFGATDVAGSGSDPDLLPLYLKPSRLLSQLGTGDDTHYFLHATFQEYLAAGALEHEPPERATQRLHAHVHDATWQEVFHFLAAQPGPLRDAFWREMSGLAARPDRFGIVLARLARWVAATGAKDGGTGLLGRDLRDLLWPFIERISASRIWVEAYAELDAAGFVRRAEETIQATAPRVRARLQRALTRVRNPAASHALVDQILSDDDQKGAVAATQLHVRIDSKSRDRLREAAADPSRSLEARRLAVRALGYARDRDSLNLLRRIATDEPPLTEEVARSLGRIGGGEATAGLVAMLEWTDGIVQRSAVRALGEMRDAPARDALLDEIARRREDDPLIVPILDALAEIPIHRGAELIVGLLASEAPEIRRAAAWALAEASGPGVFEGLVAAADDPDEEVRCAALEVFQGRARPDDAGWLALRIGDESKPSEERAFALRAGLAAARRYADAPEGHWLTTVAVEQVLLALRDPEGDLALEAAAHAEDAGPSVGPRLVELCLETEASTFVRELACAALGKLQYHGAVEALVRLLRDAPDADDDEDQLLETEAHRIARAAAEALARIDAGLLLREPGSTAYYALARFAVETGCLVYEDHIMGPDGREWARAEVTPEPPAPLESSDMEPSTAESSALEIHVWIEPSAGRNVLMYQLHSPSAGFNFLKVRGPELGMAPEVFGRQFFDQIEKLHEGFDVEGQQLLLKEAADELVSLGRWLYEALFSFEMKAHYRRFRKVDKLQITSTEAAIPWELVKPYDDSDRADVIDDDFLCMRFQLTRWLSGATSPRPVFPVRRLACISGSKASPDQSKNLTERDLLAGLAHRYPGVEDASPSGSAFADVESLFKKGGIDLYHFMGHGDFMEGSPAEAKIVLTDRPFRARNLAGPIRTRMRDDRPFVVFNACRVARQGWSLAGLDGWAHAWVELCQCGAFVGPHWLVKASAANEFARVLYEDLEKGKTLGEASLAARHAVRKLDAGRPNWLAYAVYGNPNARMTFGAESVARPEKPESQENPRIAEGLALAVRPEPGRPAEKDFRSHEIHAEAVRGNAERVRRGLEPYVLPRISRWEVREKYLPAIRESVARARGRIIPIIASAGFGKSTVLGEIYDALRQDDLPWLALIDSGELSLAAPQDFPLALGRSACGSAVSIEELAARLSLPGPGVLLIDTLDLVLEPGIVPHLQRALFLLGETSTTVVFTCRDHEYQLLEPPTGRIPQVADRVDRYTLPVFTEGEITAAAEAFIEKNPWLRGTLKGLAFVEKLKSLSADSRSLRRITSNPLLLAMLCEVFGEEGDLPRDLTVSELYERYWDEKVARSREYGPGSPVVLEKPAICLRIAQRVLEEWHQEVHDWIAEPDLHLEASVSLANARDELFSEGILKAQSAGRVRFFHQTFLEYAMARWLATRSGAAERERIVGAVSSQDDGAALHWWPVLRQLLVMVEPEAFSASVARLPLESLAGFRTVSFATLSRAEPGSLKDLLERSLTLGAEYQKILGSAAEDAPSRFLEDAWMVVETLLRAGAREAAVLAATTAGSLLARDQKPLAERLRALMKALDERLEKTERREEMAEIMGQLLRASLPALKAGSDPEALQLLRDRYLDFGEKGRAAVIDLFGAAPMDEQRRAEFVHFLLERPPERRLKPELIALLEQRLRAEGAAAEETPEGRSEILYRTVPEPWISFHARAVARLFPQDRLLVERIARDLFSSDARSPRSDTNALEEMVELGQADQVCGVLAALPPENLPAGRIGSLATLVRELSQRAGSRARRDLAHWLRPQAERRPEEALEVFASVADADEETWSAFLVSLRSLLEKQEDRLAKRVFGEITPESRLELAPEIEVLASHQPGRVSFEYMLIDAYAPRASESKEAVSRLVALSLSRSKGVALAASNALARVLWTGTLPAVTDLLSLAASPVPGVRDHLMDVVTAIQGANGKIAPGHLVLLCDSLAGETNTTTLQKLCDVVAGWVYTEKQVPLRVAEHMAGLTSGRENGKMEKGVAGALVHALKVLAQLERPEIADLLQGAAQRALGGIENLNRLSVGESELIDLLSALARVDKAFLPRLVGDGPNLPARNIRPLALSIRRVEGANSPLLTSMLSSNWCPPQTRSAILAFRGA